MAGYCMHCMANSPSGAAFCPECGKSQKTTVPVHHLLPGTLLGDKFYVGCALGEGGFGITYIGLDTKLNIKVAIKEFYPNGFANRNNTHSSAVSMATSADRESFFLKCKGKFLDEAMILAKFSGESGIVDVRDFFEENNTAYIVMEYLDGITLKDYLKKNGKLSPEKVLELLTPVMESLKKVHAKGLIHRDISPDNVMLVNGTVKLLDFGAAREVSVDSQKSLTILLKHGYAPYEQHRTNGKQGPWTDIYALCATIYKCITGMTPLDVTDRVMEDTLVPPSQLGVDIPKQWEDAILKGMALNFTQRFGNIDELLSAFGIKTSVDEDLKKAPVATPSQNDDSELTVSGFTELISDNNTAIPSKVPFLRQSKLPYIKPTVTVEPIKKQPRKEISVAEPEPKPEPEKAIFLHLEDEPKLEVKKIVTKKRTALTLMALLLILAALFVEQMLPYRKSIKKTSEQINSGISNQAGGIFDFTVSAEETQFALPCKLADMTDKGWKIATGYNTDQDDRMVKANNGTMPATLKKGTTTIIAIAYNPTSQPMSLDECSFKEFRIQANGGEGVTLSNRLSLQSTKSEILEKMEAKPNSASYEKYYELCYNFSNSSDCQVIFQFDSGTEKCTVIKLINKEK